MFRNAAGLAFGLMLAAGGARGEGALPVVVLLGDSIRVGYAPEVAETLRGRARVVADSPDGGESRNVLAHLDDWAIRHKPAVVHLNAGLHDIAIDPGTGRCKVPIEAYRANLAAIVGRLERETSARVVIATTTPIGPGNRPVRLREADVEAYNRAARAVAAASAVTRVDDLHAIAPRDEFQADGIHFTAGGSKALGRAVVVSVIGALRDPEAARAATCRWADNGPVLDGRLDDPAWAAADPIGRFPAFWNGTESDGATKARLVWDADALYFAAEMADAELRSFGARRNDQLWDGDVFELFFKPALEKPGYYEFQANPRSLVVELAFPSRGADFAKLAAGPPLGTVAAARVDGTLDAPGDVDRGWTVEGKVPWSAFVPTGGRPAPGDAWSFALCRYDHGPNGTEPRLSSCAPLRRRSFHRYEDYGRLTFEGPARAR